MNNLPDAIHVGFSKCGSTFLQTFFNQHPEIFLVHKFHFFSPFEYSGFEKGIAYYSKAFQNAKPGQMKIDSDEHILLPLYHPVLGSASTTMESIEEEVKRIKSIVPKCKIIIVIRNHTSLITSRYSEYLLGGGKESFSVFVNEFLSCTVDGLNYYQNFYHRILTMFYDKFGYENVLLILQEQLMENQKQTIEMLCNFLQIKIKTDIEENARNRRIGLSHLGSKLMKNLNQYFVIEPEKFTSLARVKISYSIYKNLQRTIRILDYYLPDIFKGNRNDFLSEEIKYRLKELFNEDNRKLSELLQKDLQHWGYY